MAVEKEDFLHWRRRRSHHTRETVREVRAESLPPEVMEMLEMMTARIKMLEARIARLPTAIAEAHAETREMDA